MGLENPSIGDDRAFNNPETAQIGPGEKWTVEFTPENTGTTFVLPELAASKQRQTTYEIKLDGTQVYLSDIPPTDIDDSTQTWVPPRTFESKLTAIVRNFSNSPNTYHVQPKGWETSESPNGGSN